MKLVTAFLYCLMLISNYAAAHTELSKPAIGFIYLQDFHTDRPTYHSSDGDYEPTARPKGVSLFGEMGSVPLTAFDYIQLKSIQLGQKRQYMAYVFEQSGDRYQVRTDESQFLWVRKADTSGYLTVEELLLDSCIYLDISAAKKTEIATTPKNDLSPIRSWTEVIDERIFTAVELKAIDGEIWIRLSPKWYEQWHSKTKANKNDTVFDASRWTVAHDIHGLIAFDIVGSGTDCE